MLVVVIAGVVVEVVVVEQSTKKMRLSLKKQIHPGTLIINKKKMIVILFKVNNFSTVYKYALSKAHSKCEILYILFFNFIMRFT